MRIGYACIPLGIQYRTNRKMILKNYSEDKWIQIVEQNLSDLMMVLKYNVKHKLYLFRISSEILPFGSHDILDIDWQHIFSDKLFEIGEYIKENEIRVSMHPGQYTVLNSPNKQVIQNGIKDLVYHTNFLDSLNLDQQHKIVLHIGGVYGNKEEAIQRFKLNYNKLPENVKGRLVIENDDRHFTMNDVLNIGLDCHIPVVYDNLHHDCNHDDSMTIHEIMVEVKKTWKQEDGRVKVHYSQQAEGKKIGAHSSRVKSKKFMDYYKEMKDYSIDIMLETKDKDISAIKCKALIDEFNGQPDKKHLGEHWAKYKYLLMERNNIYYRECSQLVKEGCTYDTFYHYIDEKLDLEIDRGNFINAAEHVWGYVNEEATFRESSHYRSILSKGDYKKVKDYLLKLAQKYQIQYLIESYYFWY